MTEGQERKAAIDEAASWLKTPFHHQARVKGAGVDCAQLLIAIYHTCGLIPDINPGHYPSDFHMHRGDEVYLSWVHEHAYPVEEPKPGDIVMFKFGRCFSHGAIVVGWPMIIHAYKGEGCILSDVTKEPMASRERLFYRLKRWSA